MEGPEIQKHSLLTIPPAPWGEGVTLGAAAEFEFPLRIYIVVTPDILHL